MDFDEKLRQRAIELDQNEAKKAEAAKAAELEAAGLCAELRDFLVTSGIPTSRLIEQAVSPMLRPRRLRFSSKQSEPLVEETLHAEGWVIKAEETRGDGDAYTSLVAMTLDGGLLMLNRISAPGLTNKIPLEPGKDIPISKYSSSAFAISHIENPDYAIRLLNDPTTLDYINALLDMRQGQQ
jgi:hypothetical protein